MSDLHLSLIAFGVIVVVGVVAYNWIQEQRFRKIAQQRFRTGGDDTLMQTKDAAAGPNTLARQTVNDMRIEPRVTQMPAPIPRPAPGDGYPAPSAAKEMSDEVPLAAPASTRDIAAEVSREAFRPTPDNTVAHGTPSTGSTTASSSAPAIGQPTAATAALRKPGANLPPPLDLAIDYIVRLDFAEPVFAADLRSLLSDVLFAKTVHWRGHSATGQWEDVMLARDRLEFTALYGGLQLADRAGAVNTEELTHFTQYVQALAEKKLAVAQLPERQGALEHASKLDQFCAEVDILVGVNVIAVGSEVFAGTKIRALAEAAGFQLMPEGSYQYLDEHGVALYTLSNQESSPLGREDMKQLTTHGLTLLFDVPRVPHGLRAFDQMILFARQITESLHGTMVDDNLRPLSDDGVAKIKQQLSLIYGKMDKNGIAAGSARAQRLFS